MSNPKASNAKGPFAIKQSITKVTVTIKDGKNFRAIKQKRVYDAIGMHPGIIEKFFGKKLTFPYLLTYSINPRGKYIVDMRNGHTPVCCKGTWTPVIKRVGNFGNTTSSHPIWTCFIPREWYGFRVSRKVEAVPKKRRQNANK